MVFTVNGMGQARIFNIAGENVTISNLNLINGYNENEGGAIFCEKPMTLENVNFTNNYAYDGGAVKSNKQIIIRDCLFENNSAYHGGALNHIGATIENTRFINSHNLTFSLVYTSSDKVLTIDHCSFSDSTSKYGTALGGAGVITVRNSIFSNLHSLETGGAVVFRDLYQATFMNCTFLNTTSVKNAGAIYVDRGTLKVFNSSFRNAHGDMGGALVLLDGVLNMDDCSFTENSAIYDGAAIYISNGLADIENIDVKSNEIYFASMFNGGGIYFDKAIVTMKDSSFMDNTNNAIYAYDSELKLDNITFKGNSEAIHAVFTTCELQNLTLNNDTLLLNDTDYYFTVTGTGIEMILMNNTIDVTNLPSRYDSRDWGWVSSVKNQGYRGSCWAFGNTGALESAILKATQIEYMFAVNAVQNTMLKFSKYGISDVEEGGLREQAMEYFLSWLGPFPTEYDSYDEFGKLSPLYTTQDNIHVQDAIFVPARKNSTDNDALKMTIMKCGSVSTGYHSTCSPRYFNENTSAIYQNDTDATSHSISLVGWDDNFPAEAFATTPPGDGAFIIKNSWGEDKGDHGYYYISYYDTSLLNNTFSIGYLIENTEKYNKNYQTDLSGHLEFDQIYKSYKITYSALEKDLISAVGTYFSQDDENYTLEVYVNDVLRHVQNGTAPYFGFHTIKLTNEILVNEDDNFTVVMTKNTIPILLGSRQHYLEGMAFAKEESGNWTDLISLDLTPSLKVYTKEFVIYAEDLVMDYNDGSTFKADVRRSGENVTFEINGINHTSVSDEYGVAELVIDLNPGNYTIKTIFDGTSVENTITVLAKNILTELTVPAITTTYNVAKELTVTLKDTWGNALVGKSIVIKLNNKNYNKTTDGNGQVMLSVNLAANTYAVNVSFAGDDTYKVVSKSGKVVVKKATPKLTVKAKAFKVKAKTKKVTATLKSNTNKVIKNVKVTLKVNGKTYSAKTNSKGVATFKVKLTKKGTFKAVYKFVGNSNYKSVSKTSKITIK